MRTDAPDGPDWFDQDDWLDQDRLDQDDRFGQEDRFGLEDRFEPEDRDDRFDPDNEANRDDRNNRPDRSGPKLGPGPVTDSFGRVGLYRRVSITPPSNWRKAAWLIVATASVVLVVLVHGAVRLAVPNGRSGQIDAFPGLPTGGLLTPQPPRTSMLAGPYPSQDAGQQTPAPPTQPGTGIQTPQEAPAGGQPYAQPSAPGGRTSTGGPMSGSATSSSSQDEDAEVAEATDRFFGLLPENTDAAWLMMNPQGQQMSSAEFNRIWRRYQDVELVSTTVGADPTIVVATVVVTDHRGVSATLHWKLTYQRGEPVINKLELLDPDPNGQQPIT